MLIPPSILTLCNVTLQLLHLKGGVWDFPGGTVVKNPPASAGDTGSSPGQGRSHVLWSD